MQRPTVTENSALSAHRREVALVRWSLTAVPEDAVPRGEPDPRDPLRKVARASVLAGRAGSRTTRR